MKKISLLVIAAIFTFGLVACTAKEDKNDESTKESSEVSNKSDDSKKDEDDEKVEEESNSTAQNDSEIFSGELVVNGATVTVGVSNVQDFLDLGYSLSRQSPTDNIETGYEMISVPIENENGDRMVLGIYNTSGATVPISEAIVHSTSLSSFSTKNTDLVLPKNITNSATYEDVKAAYGEPTKIVEPGEGYENFSVEYEDEDGRVMSFSFPNKSDSWSYADYRYFYTK